MAKVTIFDIAKKAGVSTSTVSRVLNDSALISDERADQIRRIADELGYTKRTIRKPRNRAILNVMIVLPRHRERATQLFYDYSELLHGIQSAIPTDRANLFTSIEQDSLLERDHKKGGMLDAVVFAFTRPKKKIRDLLKQKSIPFLILNRIVNDADYITCDHEGGMKTIISVLKEKRPDANPCMLNLEAVKDVSSLRVKGFVQGMEESGWSKPEDRIFHTQSISAIDAALIRKIMKAGYDAIVCFNDVVAVAVMEVAARNNISIPADVSITGFDNSPVRDLVHPSPDTISMEVERLGNLTGEWLLDRVLNRESDPWQRFVRGKHVPGGTIG